MSPAAASPPGAPSHWPQLGPSLRPDGDATSGRFKEKLVRSGSQTAAGRAHRSLSFAPFLLPRRRSLGGTRGCSGPGHGPPTGVYEATILGRCPTVEGTWAQGDRVTFVCSSGRDKHHSPGVQGRLLSLEARDPVSPAPRTAFS